MGILKFNLGRNLRSRFTRIYLKNSWGSSESLSGGGSDAAQTAQLRFELPLILEDLKVKTLLDLPCGDLNWMKSVDLGSISYTGADIVPQLISDLEMRFSDSGRKFICLDATRENPGRYDAIFCRDMLVHLSHRDIIRALNNFKNSGSKYLLTTHFNDPRPFQDLGKLGWRPINFTLEPFSFPSPIRLLDELCTESDGEFADKSIAVWRLDDLVLDI
jgi:hypothetical protein